jgi:hypothetical protein
MFCSVLWFATSLLPISLALICDCESKFVKSDDDIFFEPVGDPDALEEPPEVLPLLDGLWLVPEDDGDEPGEEFEEPGPLLGEPPGPE